MDNSFSHPWRTGLEQHNRWCGSVSVKKSGSFILSFQLKEKKRQAKKEGKDKIEEEEYPDKVELEANL